jgi:hypothetical protein
MAMEDDFNIYEAELQTDAVRCCTARGEAKRNQREIILAP